MTLNPFSLDGKKILVTGATSGIGESICNSLVYFGAKIIIVGRNKSKISSLKKNLNNSVIQSFNIDLTDYDKMVDLVKEIDEIDGFVNSAGIISMTHYKFVSKKSYNKIFSINCESPIILTTQLLKRKKIKSLASLVFISSINGSCVGSKGITLYSSSKGAISGLVKSLAIDLAKLKIRVNEICPGMISTPGISSVEEKVSKSSINLDVERYPLKEYGKPEDVSNGCVYLLSDASKWVTGTKLIIDGGFTLV